MRATLGVVLVVLTFAAAGGPRAAAAQAPTPPPPASAPPPAAAPPPARPTPPVVSPELAADGKVTFRVRAPNAREAAVGGQFAKDRVAMKKDADGVWSATVGPVAPGIYEYSLWIDGFRTVDPANPVLKPTRTLGTSILEVPGKTPLLTEFQDVPHGAVHVHRYRSRALEGRVRRIHVYTPPDYEKRTGVKYPVLYLIHGSGDTDGCWTELGRAHHILDNLIAQKKAQPMIVVMPDAHALPPLPGAGPGRGLQNIEAFGRDLLEEVLPLVEGRYRVKPGGSARAIAGLSLGGSEALAVGLRNPDKFAWVASFSSAGNPEALQTALADPKALKKLRWVWLSCGKEDGSFQRMADLAKALEEKGARPIWFPTEGGHAWPVWRDHFAEIATRLFSPAGS
jgi:enterochelin esterase-like enzyme